MRSPFLLALAVAGVRCAVIEVTTGGRTYEPTYLFSDGQAQPIANLTVNSIGSIVASTDLMTASGSSVDRMAEFLLATDDCNQLLLRQPTFATGTYPLRRPTAADPYRVKIKNSMNVEWATSASEERRAE